MMILNGYKVSGSSLIEHSLTKASEKSARSSTVTGLTGRNYYLSIKIRSKKSEVISPSTSVGGRASAGPGV